MVPLVGQAEYRVGVGLLYLGRMVDLPVHCHESSVGTLLERIHGVRCPDCSSRSPGFAVLM